MGNYFEGTLTFMFDCKSKSISDSVINYANLIKKFSDKSVDSMSKYDMYVSEIKKRSDIISKGLQMWTNGHNDIRRSSCIYFALISDTFENSDPVVCSEDFEYMCDNHHNDFTEQDIINYLTEGEGYSQNFKGKDVSLIASIEFHVCDKGYNSDESLTKLIDLWSPHLLQQAEVCCIGRIEDEDWTFKKDYFVNNDASKIEHWQFCGNFCHHYYPYSTCKSDRCKMIFDRGLETGRQERD